jgi:outer membrane immunogenic protein
MVGGNRMRKTSFTFIASFSVGTILCQVEAASGQELYDWTGFYLGANAGFHDVATSGIFDGPELGVTPDLKNIGGKGVGFGVLGGYNYQIDHVVLGLEGDLNFGGFDNSFNTVQDGSASEAGLFSYPIEGDLRYLTTLRSRVGFILDDVFHRPVLLFATGGVAFTDFNMDIADARSEIGFKDIGMVWGGGVEMPVSDRMSLRMDFLHIDFNKRLNIADAATSGIFDANAGNYVKLKHVNMIHLGMDFKIGGK